MSIYHDDPPPLQSRDDVNPTLLVSWWCTIFALTTILIRIFGRWVRTEKLFIEDKIILWSIVPLLIRMGLVHVVLIYGTNNVETEGLTNTQILHRESGSRLVLAARIFYAAFIWIAKLTVLEFLKRTIGASWAKSYELGLRLIYGFLALTFIGIIIGTLAECHPFSHYWQVVPDPGPQCREGLVQLLVMGVCDIVTDLVLIIFPIPVVLRSSMPVKKKFSLLFLFFLSAILVAITAYRIPSTMDRRAAQPYRSLIASLEILAATFVANMVIIGSFIRDKGVKKAKFRQSMTANSSTSQGIQRSRTKSITMNHWGSDEDLVRDMGLALPKILRHGTHHEARAPGPAPPGAPDGPSLQEEPKPRAGSHKPSKDWGFHKSKRRKRSGSASSASSTSTDVKLRDLRDRLDPPSPGADPVDEPDNAPLSKQMSFFDVGGLVDKPNYSPQSTSRDASLKDLPAGRGRTGSRAFLSDIGGLLTRHKEEDDSIPPSQTQSKRGSQNRLGDATPRTSTHLQTVRDDERRKFSRSPRPSRILEGLRLDGSRSRNPSKEARRRDGEGREERTPRMEAVRVTGREGGFDEMNFGDIGGLLK
jgi:hypothetical protein